MSSDAVPANNSEAVVKSPKSSTKSAKPKSTKPKPSHPTYSQMIINAIKTLKETNGSSRQAILKFIITNYNLEPKLASVRARLTIKAALANGTLKHGKSNGSFKVGEKVILEEKAKIKKDKEKAKQILKKAKDSENVVVKKSSKTTVKKTKVIEDKPATKSPKKVIKVVAKKNVAKPKASKREAGKSGDVISGGDKKEKVNKPAATKRKTKVETTSPSKKQKPTLVKKAGANKVKKQDAAKVPVTKNEAKKTTKKSKAVASGGSATKSGSK